VDTGAMDARVLASPNFTHLSVPAGNLPLSAVPGRVDILTSDMNLEPNLVLDYVGRLAGHLRPRLLILTLKMNDPKIEARVPAFLEKVRKLGLEEVRAKQLPANRRDICVLAGSLA
jgi:23S rRNA (cytidine2498-2'-O)-methyltransferase